MTKTKAKRALVAQQPVAAMALARKEWTVAETAFHRAKLEAERLEEEFRQADVASDIAAPAVLHYWGNGLDGRRTTCVFQVDWQVRKYFGMIARKLDLPAHPREAEVLEALKAHHAAEHEACQRHRWTELRDASTAADAVAKAAAERLMSFVAPDAEAMALKARAASLAIEDALDPATVDGLATMMLDPDEYAEGLVLASLYFDALSLAGRGAEAYKLKQDAVAEVWRQEGLRIARKDRAAQTPDPTLEDEDGFSVAAWVERFRSHGGVVRQSGDSFQVYVPLDARDAVAAQADYDELLAEPSKSGAIEFFVSRGLI